MTTPLPTFRALTSAAVELHLAAIPSSGSALVLRNMVPATPLTDEAIVPALQHAQVSIMGSITALQELDDSPKAGRCLVTCWLAHRAYHVALMAYFGVDVTAEQGAA